jgi:hypothetical protein
MIDPGSDADRSDLGLSRSNRLPVAVLRDRPHRNFRAQFSRCSLFNDEAVESLNIIAHIFAIAGVALFEWINGKALANTYLLLDATLDQYRALYGQADRFQPDFFRHFVSIASPIVPRPSW